MMGIKPVCILLAVNGMVLMLVIFAVADYGYIL